MISVVVPIFNEEEIVNKFHTALVDAMKDIGEAWEVVYINDGSRDSSLKLLTELQTKDTHVVVVDLSRNWGHMGAISAGLQTAHGDAVNTAARLEVTNKIFATAILISKATRDGVPDVKARPLGKINLRGKEETTEAFEPLEENDPAAGYADRLSEILEDAERDPVAAVAALDDLIRRHPDDRVLCVIRDRIDCRDGDVRRVA